MMPTNFARKLQAQRAFKELTAKLGYRPAINLQKSKLADIETINRRLTNEVAQLKVPRRNVHVKRVNNRSMVIHMIKEINPKFRSSKSDTTNDLLRKYRENLPKKSFIESLKSHFQNSELINFLKHPVDETSIRVSATELAEYLHYKNNENGYYLQMEFDKSEQTEMEDGEMWRFENTEYIVISNIKNIQTLLDEMREGYSEEEITIPQGSDVQTLYKYIRYGGIVKLTWYSTETYRKVHSGAYFKYFHKTNLDLTRYQIFKREDDSRDADKEACIMYALKQSGKITESDIALLKLEIFNKEVKSSDLKNIAKQLGITIRLRYDAKHGESVLNKGCDNEVSIGLVDNHYFLNEITNITKYALDHYEDVKDDVKFPDVHNPKSHKKMKPLTSFQVINKLYSEFKDTLLTPITMNNIKNKQTVEKLVEYGELRAPKFGCGCFRMDKECKCETDNFFACKCDESLVPCLKVKKMKKPISFDDLTEDDFMCMSSDDFEAIEEENRKYEESLNTECHHYFCKVKSILENCECKNAKHEFKDYGYLSEKKPFKGFFKKAENDPNLDFDIWFIDTETFIKKRFNYHIANTLCAIKYNEKSETYQEFEFFGLDCVKQFLDTCINKHSIIYAHNMAFDFRMIVDYISDLKTPIETGTKLKQIQGMLKRGKEWYHVLFKDSYSFLPVKLSAIPKMLDLPCGDKEVFPYELINEDTYDKVVPVFQCRKHIKVGLRKAFMTNAIKIGAYNTDERTVDMKKYTIHYCMQDTRILAHGFIKFRKQIQEVCKLDILTRVSLPQLADDYLKSKGVYNDCFAISGIAQDFIRRCCVGGRVMSNSGYKYHIQVDEKHGFTKINENGITTINKHKEADKMMDDYYSLYRRIRSRCSSGRGNKRVLSANGKKQLTKLDNILISEFGKTEQEIKHFIKLNDRIINSGAVADFDAVSLYPSAMSMLKGYIRGLPKVLSEKQIKHFNFISSAFDAFYVEIEVLSHTINRDFPLQSIKTDKGIRNFTNDIDGKHFYVDNIALADFVQFQGVKYRVIRGYYFDDGFNTKINEEINFLFNERNRLKKEGNNLQNVYKLLMNASYGKLIQKAIKSSKTFIKKADIRKFVAQHHKFISSFSKVNDDLFVVKQEKSIITHFTACHIASHILSMSKRLMNRVMCLAEDEGIKIYYQDTDSMHIHERAIPALGEAFKAKYGSELIGKAMCQFHSDFEVSDKGAKNVRAIETIILGKKCYIDKLAYENKFGNKKYAFHIRIKGVPTEAVRDYSDNYLDTYMSLLDGETIEFNLEKYCPLQIDTDYRARKNTRCTSRKLHFD